MPSAQPARERDVRGKQGGVEGGRHDASADAGAHQGSTRGWQLFTPAASGPEPGPAGGPAGQSLEFLRGHQALGRTPNLPLDYTPARPVPAPLWPLTHHPVPSQVSGHRVLVPTFATLAWGREDSLREMCS